MEVCCQLLSANDQDNYNDCVSRSDQETYTFEVSHEFQLQSFDILRPKQGEVMLANRPFVPLAQFKNVGIGDASDVPAQMIVKKLPSGTEVYHSNVIIQDIQAGRFNTKEAEFEIMTLRDPGQYQVCIIITEQEDIVREDDTLCTTFTVDPGMQGTFTVGKAFLGQSRNYPTIDSVMNDLYYKGINGPIRFELTDDSYDVRSIAPTLPAWDFRSKIIGLGYDQNSDTYNTITWTTHRSRAATKGGVTVNLYSGNGQGVSFGQSIFPTNPNAIVYKFTKPENVNSPGYIIFDGGSQKSLKFVLKSGSDVHGSAFYFDRGSHDITVKNCVLENGTPSQATNTSVPMIIYDPSNGYTFQADSSGSGTSKRSYSAGVTIRNSLLRLEQAEFIKLDTVINARNTVEGNEISGFGYGVVSLGLGPLFMETQAVYKRFYNTGNKITNNTIYDIARAGILFGNEENSEISGNRIYNIGKGNTDAAGILIGGCSHDGFEGYNNIGVKITGNEISGITSPTMVHGIKVEQVRKSYQNPAGGVIYFPDVAEKVEVTNNMIWGLTPSNAAAQVAGIHMLTERTTTGDAVSQLVTPNKASYWSRDDRVMNNTVIISNDGGLQNTGPMAGIGVQQCSNALVYNNAIAFEDNSVDGNSLVASAIFYEGLMPKDGGIQSDRNAFWLGSSNATIFRFVETDVNSNIVEPGNRNEFKTIDQWQLWTGGEGNSVVGNFMKDMAYTGNAPKKLRVVLSPQAPLLDTRQSRRKNQQCDHRYRR